MKMFDEEELQQCPKKINDTFKKVDDTDVDNIIKILIATDIHLGYEQTTKRAQEDDSFRTFEEILEYAKNNEVDMILLGGDLFHEAKPSHNVVTKCVNLLRKYCLGNKPVKLQFLTDPEQVFSHCEHKTVNYEDPNFNVGIPLFTIHGNHDDPSFGAVGSIDVLSATGLINYFGKWTDVTQVSIPPLILRKGITTISLYGLSYMNDQRLSRLMRNDKFKMLVPKNIENPFNIFVLHQNRAQHSQNSFIPEELLPEFLNLVIWGHEHECRILPEESKTNSKVFICQPGSSVATSLAQGESVKKFVGILHVYKRQFKMVQLPLKTVRPFVFDDLVINEHEDEITKYKSRSEGVEDFVDSYIENTMIAEAANQLSGHSKQPEKPLIRLRVFYSDDRDLFDSLRLTQKYYQVTANPNDMIVFRKCSAKLKKKQIKGENDDLEEIAEIFQFNDKRNWKQTVQGGMFEYFSQDNKMNKLTVLSLTGLNEALSRFVNANDVKAFQDLVKHQMKKTVNHLMKGNYKSKEEVLEAIKQYRDQRLQKEEQEKTEEQSFFNSRKDIPMKNKKNSSSSFQEEDNVEEKVVLIKGRGSERLRGITRSKEMTEESPAKKSKGRAIKKLSTLDITTSGGSNQSLLSWKKPSQTSSGRSAGTKKLIQLDSDSE